MKEKIPTVLILTVAFLITGNLIGAGILALPINTGLSGFIPSLVGMTIIGSAMFFTAIVLGNEASKERKATFNYPSLYQKHLGNLGKWIAVLANLLILYGLLTAYLTGGATIITSLFHLPVPAVVVMAVFFLIVTGLTVMDISIVRKYNTLIMMILFLSFAIIVFQGEEHVVVSRFAYTDWAYLPAAAPIIVTAFHFHNIIPTICHDLKWNNAAIWKAMLLGMTLGFVMNAIWIQVGVGALPLTGGAGSLLEAFKQNLPATIPLSRIIQSHLFATGSMVFALLAITTSYMANGIGLMGFVDDLTENFFHKKSRFLTIILAFLPPLTISVIYPDIFLKAIDIVGGVGIVILFGILPSIIVIRQSKSSRMRLLGMAMFALFALLLALEIGQECGLLHIHPSVEYWAPNIGAHGGK
ncbi:MAG: aromatic amino acid transport family protein [Syntrophales bacterium]|nr:aromatic amino acid transport family protein [Syntrophales bacterium]